jgi:hypothetical protein
MAKPTTLEGYTDEYTLDCERVLVTLLRGLGPWKDSVFLVGGLTPRYLVRARPPDVPPHAGTQDVDIVIDLQLLTDTQAYHTLEENLHARGFTRTTNEKGQKLSWRWQTRTEQGALMVLELLADAPRLKRMTGVCDRTAVAQTGASLRRRQPLNRRCSRTLGRTVICGRAAGMITG